MLCNNSFPLPVKRYGLLALPGVLAFVSSLIIVHLGGNSFDWMRDYLSNLAHQPLSWVFTLGAIIHGFGNLALAQGLRGALLPQPLRSWAVALFSLAAVGILLAAAFPIDAPDQPSSLTGQIHRIAASATFLFELAALFIFSILFGRDYRWRQQQATSQILTITAAIALELFMLALQLDIAMGLAERLALAIMLIWEIWAIFQLLRSDRSASVYSLHFFRKLFLTCK